MDFSDIVERSRALRSLQEASASKLTDSIPRLERALPQIDYESRRLLHASAAAPLPGTNNTQTHQQPHQQQERALRLLSEYGYETDKIERTLQSVALLDSAFEPLQATPDTDLQSYLDASNELIVAATFDAAVRRARTRSLNSLACSIDTEWDVSKRDLLSSSSSVTAPPIGQHLVVPRRVSQRLSSSHVFSSPFRQPRAARLSSAFDSAVNPSRLQHGTTPLSTRAPHSSLRGVPGGRPSFGPEVGGLGKGPSENQTGGAQPSIYYEIVRNVVYSGYRPRPLDETGFDADYANVSNLSAVSAVRVATEFDDCLLEHFAPRGDASAAPKSVQQLHAVYNALRYIVGEDKMGKSSNSTDRTSPSSRQETALNTPGNQRPSIAPLHPPLGKQSKSVLLSKLARGAQRFLCLQFREDKMRREMEARPVEARRGGVPGVRADVRAYLNLVFDHGVPSQLSPLFDGMPIWAFIYYLLRAGFETDALQLIDDALANGCTSVQLSLFADVLRAYIDNDRNIPDDVLHTLVQEYGVSVKRGSDPYMRAVFVIVARLDPAAGDKIALLDSDYSLLFYSVEDYLWLRLSVARVDGVDQTLPAALAAYTLSVPDIGSEMIRFGPSHFNPQGESPAFYALVLLLSAQFKEAVTYLDEKARNITDAIHIAFVLYHYGLIIDHSDDSVDGGVNTEKDPVVAQLQVDYAGLVWKYASRMCATDPCAAATYVFSVDDTVMRNQLTKKLILRASGSQQCDALLGRHGDGGVLAQLWVRKTGVDALRVGDSNSRETPGMVASGHDSWKTVVVQAGDEAERKGERDTALQLYEIAGVHDKMMQIHLARVSAEVCNINTSLSLNNAFHQHQQQNRQMIMSDARAFLQQLRASGGGVEDVGERSVRCLHILLNMGHMFELKAEQRFTEALQVLENDINLLPTDDAAVISKSAELSYTSKSANLVGGGGIWCDAVIDRVPDLIVAAMEVIAAVLTGAGIRRDGEELGNEERLRLRKWARCIVNLAGMMRNVSADMSARLVNLEVVIN